MDLKDVTLEKEETFIKYPLGLHLYVRQPIATKDSPLSVSVEGRWVEHGIFNVTEKKVSVIFKKRTSIEKVPEFDFSTGFAENSVTYVPVEIFSYLLEEVIHD